MSGGAAASYGALTVYPPGSVSVEIPVSSSDPNARFLGNTAEFRLLRARDPSAFDKTFVLGQVGQPERLAHFDVFLHSSNERLVTVTQFGERMSGHAGLVHGGATVSGASLRCSCAASGRTRQPYPPPPSLALWRTQRAGRRL